MLFRSNTAGITGLLAALKSIKPENQTREDFLNMLREFKKIKGIKVLCAQEEENQGELFSFIPENKNIHHVISLLNKYFGIIVKEGLHGATLAHKTLNTFSTGSIRISPSVYHTPEDFEYLIHAVKKIISH